MARPPALMGGYGITGTTHRGDDSKSQHECDSCPLCFKSIYIYIFIIIASVIIIIIYIYIIYNICIYIFIYEYSIYVRICT